MLLGKLDVSIGIAGRDRDPVPVHIGVGGTQPLIKRLTGAARAALQAHNPVKRAGAAR